MSDRIPCIKDKCILLPICKSKIEIICNTLYQHVHREILKQREDVNNTYSYNDKVSEIKRTVEVVLHKTYRLYNDQGYLFYLDGNCV